MKSHDIPIAETTGIRLTAPVLEDRRLGRNSREGDRAVPESRLGDHASAWLLSR